MARQTNAQKLQEYRELVTRMARRAQENGASFEEINSAMADFGLPPLRSTDAPGRRARYRAQIWVEVETPDMNQDQAQAELDRYLAENNDEDYISMSDDTNGHEMVPGSIQWRDSDDADWQPAEEFWAAQTSDQPAPEPVTDLAELKRQVRKHFLRLASIHGWSCGTFSRAWSDLDLGDVPRRTSEYREVPVTATVQIQAVVWDGMSDEDKEALFAAQVRNLGTRTYVQDAQIAGPTRTSERRY